MKSKNKQFNINDLFIGINRGIDSSISWRIVTPVSYLENDLLNNVVDGFLNKNSTPLTWFKDIKDAIYYASTDKKYNFRTISCTTPLVEFTEKHGINITFPDNATLKDLTDFESFINEYVNAEKFLEENTDSQIM